MSNTAFTFLSDSFLFIEAGSYYKSRTVDEIENELNRYRDYIRNNITSLKQEIYKDINFIQPLKHTSKLPTNEELLHGSIFLDTYLINDPIFDFSIQRQKMANIERKCMNLPEVTDDDLKRQLSDLALYMKNLTPGVDTEVGYIKFFPFSMGYMPTNVPIFSIPDLSIDKIEKNVFEWFFDHIQVQNLNGNVGEPTLELSNKIAINFENDDGDSFIYHYQALENLKQVGTKVLFSLNLNHIPDEQEYINWVGQEIIKSIKSKIDFFKFRDSICKEFNSPICLSSPFEKDFYSTNFNSEFTSDIHQLGFNINLPGLNNMTFIDAMKVRNRSRSSFLAFQEKIKEDSKQLRTASDEKTYNEVIRKIEYDYKEEIKSTNILLESMKSLISFPNLINVGLFAHSYYTGQETKLTTGLTIANGIYNVYSVSKQFVSNPIFYMKQINKFK